MILQQQQSMNEKDNQIQKENQDHLELRHDTNDTDIVRVDRDDGIGGDDDDNKANTNTNRDNKYVLKRIKELAKGNECHLLIGGIGAFFTGLIFPCWGVQFAYTIKLLLELQCKTGVYARTIEQVKHAPLASARDILSCQLNL